MRWLFGSLGLFALVVAVAGAVFFVLMLAIYSGLLTSELFFLLIILVVGGGVWMVERAWRKIIGAKD